MDKVIAEWDKAAKKYSDHQQIKEQGAFCRDFINNHFNEIKGLKILDLGCGDGTYTSILAKKDAIMIGCDGSLEMLKLARQKCDCQFDQVDLLKPLPYENNEFDIVLCNLVLMTIDSIDR